MTKTKPEKFELEKKNERTKENKPGQTTTTKPPGQTNAGSECERPKLGILKTIRAKTSQELH